SHQISLASTNSFSTKIQPLMSFSLRHFVRNLFGTSSLVHIPPSSLESPNLTLLYEMKQNSGECRCRIGHCVSVQRGCNFRNSARTLPPTRLEKMLNGLRC